MNRRIIQNLALLLAMTGCAQRVEVNIPPVETLVISTEEVTVRANESYPLSISFLPTGTSSPVKWTSENEEIATVSSIGVVSGISEGTTVINAVAVRNPGAGTSCTVTVLPPKEPDIAVTSIKFSQDSWQLEKGATLDLSKQYTLLPENATNKSVKWQSSNTAIAMVNSGGIVTGISKGETSIKLSADDGSEVYGVCRISVTAEDEGEGGEVGPTPDPAPDPRITMFDSCDNLEGFTENPGHRTGVSIETVGRQEGSGYIQRICGSDAEIFILSHANPMDSKIKNKSKGHLTFWFFIDDAAKLKSKTADGGRIEISHSGSPQLQCLSWPSKEWISEKVTDGWNFIDLPFSKSTEMTPDDPFNPQGPKYFRIYFNGPASSTEFVYGLDAVGFYEEE